MYQALYRKYRPKHFDDVVGQDYVIKTLKNSIINNKISHAYMFFGPRGIGKTTIAKIFARAVNCENPQNGNPCEECSKCLNSKNTETVDIIEIDAASNNGVDEIREIKSKVNIVPSDLKYKVYIIDEVHMLTPGAFNALLKTLEEPPKHVIFILATTDPQKVSETIISRCQCFSFKRISNDSIIYKLKEICEKENIQIQDQVLNQIAISSNGGLRDALSSLDKISSYKQDMITLEDYLEMNDLISQEELNDFVNIIFKNDIKDFILTLNKYYNNGKNLVEILNQILYYITQEIISYYVDKKELSFELDKYQTFVNLINEKMFDIKKSSDPKIYIELMILSWMEQQDKPHSNNTKKTVEQIATEPKNEEFDGKNYQKIISQEIIQPDEVLQEKVKTPIKEEIENKDGSKIQVTEKVKKQDNYFESNILDIMKIRLNNTLAQANKQEKLLCEQEFSKLNDYVFNPNKGYLISELLNSKIRAASKDLLVISYEYDSIVEQNLKQIDELMEVLTEFTTLTKRLAIITDDMWEKEKQNYIKITKNHQKYDIIEEPELIQNKIEEKEETSLLEEFGDIVEIK